MAAAKLILPHDFQRTAIKNRSDQRHIREVGLRQVDKAILRVALREGVDVIVFLEQKWLTGHVTNETNFNKCSYLSMLE